jgi:Protein of unknown function (DUF1501)
VSTESIVQTTQVEADATYPLAQPGRRKTAGADAVAGASRPPLRNGKTDDFEGKVHVHDWHATILHLLGLDHEKLTFRYSGRDMRLTDVKGNVVKEILG